MKRGVFCAAVALACASCGNPHGFAPVSGKVMYRGAPAVGAAVFFHRRGADPLGEQTIMGIVQPDGSFTLDCGALGKGAPPGEYEVLVHWRHPHPAKGKATKGTDRLKGRYADPARPLLHAIVKAGPNSLPPFELTD
jgi:hypothetical protein